MRRETKRRTGQGMKTMKIIIKHRHTQVILLSGQYKSIKNCLERNKGANLEGADFEDANLKGADFENANLPHFFIIPEIGIFIAWKKGRDGCIIKLQIPAAAKRNSCLTGRECRAEYAKTIAIYDANGKHIKKCKCWNRDYDFEYVVGQTAKPDKYNPDIRIECTDGIHFFITKKEAEEF